MSELSWMSVCYVVLDECLLCSASATAPVPLSSCVCRYLVDTGDSQELGKRSCIAIC